METQQMMELVLVREAIQEEMMKANQEKQMPTENTCNKWCPK
jgi:hypothetical protein